MVADTLITKRLILRQPKASDLGGYTRYCQSERSRAIGGPLDSAEAFHRFASMIGHWTLRGFGRYAIELNGVGIGHVGPLALTDEVPDMTWTLWEAAHEGHGYATEAAHACIRHLLLDCGWPSLQICIKEDNDASHEVAVRLGAKRSDRASPEWYPGARVYDIDANCLT